MMRKRTILTGLLVAAGLAAAAGAASAQAPAAAAGQQVFLFPEEKGNPPPPGAPNQQEALAAHLNGRAHTANPSDPPDLTKPTPAPPAPGAPAPQPPPGRTVPPILTIGPVPDPTHIKFALPDDIPWSGREGQNQTWNIFGSPTTPGPYMQMMKWWPGAYSGPHMHPNTRYALVMSGTWWVCSCATQDKTKTYPLPAGTYVAEPPYTYHWDGARNEPAVLLLWGNGPSPNISVDERGLPRPQAARPAGAAPGGAPAGAPRPGGD